MPGVQIKLALPFGAEPGRQLLSNQVVHPDPGARAKRGLQRARPINSAMKRIFLEPVVELRANLGQIRGVARESIRLRQDHQVLMAIQLPNDLVISGLARVEIGNPAKIAQPGFDSAGVIAPPGDRRAGVDGQTENRKAMRTNLFRERDCLLRKGSTAERLNDTSSVRQREPRFEIRIELELRRTPAGVRVPHFLPDSKRDLTGCAQRSHSTLGPPMNTDKQR